MSMLSSSCLLSSRRSALRRGLALGAGCFLPTMRTAHACEFFTPHLRVTHPWTRVTSEDAPFAIVSMRIDQVTKADRLIGVETPVASRAVIGGISTREAGLNLTIERGRELVLSEHGMHLRLLGLTQPLLIGRSYPMQLVFEQGGTMQAELSVDYMANPPL